MEFRSPAPQKGLGKDPEAVGLLCAEQKTVLACAYTVSPLHSSQTPRPQSMGRWEWDPRMLPLAGQLLVTAAWPFLLNSSLRGIGSVVFLSCRWRLTPQWGSHGRRKFSGSEAKTIVPAGVLARLSRAGRGSTIFLGSQHPERGTED